MRIDEVIKVKVPEKQQGQTNEGIKSALAGAALAGTMALGGNAAKAEEMPTPKQQIIAAIKANKIPMPREGVSVTREQGGVVIEVEIDGQIHQMPVTQKTRSMLALAQQARNAMMRES